MDKYVNIKLRIKKRHLAIFYTIILAILMLASLWWVLERDKFLVKHVIDGDTIEVKQLFRAHKVRLIGIDTPETGQCYSEQATDRAKQLLLEGQKVRLVADSTQDDKDIYGRLLRYVYLLDSNNTNINKQLIQEGFAREYTYQTEYKLAREFRDAQDIAKSGILGWWKDCNPNGYDDIDTDCEDYSTWDEAQDYFMRDGGSNERNIDGLDADRDGTACDRLLSDSNIRNNFWLGYNSR